MSDMHELGTMRVKSGLAEMLKGGVIMDVVDAEQAKIAEEAGACAVMALERVPADIRRDGGVARMSDPDMIKAIQEAVSIPVMAKCRIGHFAEAQILQSLEIDYIDESEVLTPADLEHHVDKWQFTVPFVCGCTNLGEALRRIAEGAAMIRTKGEAGTGDIVNAVTHMRSVFGGIRRLQSLRGEELYTEAKNLQAPYDLVRWVAENGKLPVVTFTAGGIATPPTRRSACSSAPTACSSAPASSSPAIPPSGRVRSSRRRRTTSTPTCSPVCRRVSARRWSASRRRRSIRASCSKRAAGSLAAPVGADLQRVACFDPTGLEEVDAAPLLHACRRSRPIMATLLVTGGGGTLGRTLVAFAPARGWQVRATCWTTQPELAADWLQTDVRDADAVARAVDGVAAVIHTAYRQDEDAWSTNVDGSETVARASAGRRLIHLSSDVVFDGTIGHYREEDVPPR